MVGHSWQDIEALCEAQSAGRQFITLRGREQLITGERLLVSLCLPDEMVISLEVEVVAVDRRGDEVVARVELSGLSPEMCARLRSMAVRASPPTQRDSTYLRVPTRDHAPVIDRTDDTQEGVVLAALRPRRTPSELPVAPDDESS